jgi:hypothetical protein
MTDFVFFFEFYDFEQPWVVCVQLGGRDRRPMRVEKHGGCTFFSADRMAALTGSSVCVTVKE